MNVPCRKCGALVPADHAFCTECGALMAESITRQSPVADSEEFAATMLGQYPLEPDKGVDAPPKSPTKESRPSAERLAAAIARSQAVTTPVKAKSRSGLYFILGLLAVLLLGGLLLYLLSVILSRSA